MTNATNLLHVALDVADLERSIDFYTRLFAAPPVRREADYAKFEPADLPLVLSLNPTPTAPSGPQRLSHLGVRVASAEALAALRERVARADLTAREEHGTACCYAIADKLWVADPDGNAWELYQRLGDAPVRYPGAGECCVPTADAAESGCGTATAAVAASSCCTPR